MQNVNGSYMADKRSKAIRFYEKLEVAIKEAKEAKNWDNFNRFTQQQDFLEFELQCLGVEMTPEQIRGDELTPDELNSGRWHERLGVGDLEYGELDEESCFGWADDDGNTNMVEFGVEMDNDWWEAQFSQDAGVKSVSDALPGEPVETTWHPNWEHLMKVSEARNGLRDKLLNRIDEVDKLATLNRACKVVGKYSAWAIFLGKGKRQDAYGNLITNHGLDYRRYAIVMNELFKKACQLKGHTKALEKLPHLLYTDPEERDARQKLATDLTKWGKKALGNGFKAVALLAYPERSHKEGDILDHAAQKGEHEMENSDNHTFSQYFQKELDDYLEWRSRFRALPQSQMSFRMSTDEIMEWMTTPLQSPLTQPLHDLFVEAKKVYLPPKPSEMGF